MSYIGNTSTTQAFTPAIDYFSGDGSTVAFTLSRPVASVAQVQVVVNNVPQNPSSAFTVSGNTITFTGAPSSGTNNIYVEYTSPITQVIAPGQGTVAPASLSQGGPSWDTSGNVTLTGSIALNNGAADGAQLTLSSSGYSDWNWDNYSGRLRAYYGSTEYFTINSSGNVGIGTGSPLAPLHIQGSATGAVQAFIKNSNGATGSSAELVFGNWSGSIPSGTGNPGPQARIAAINLNSGNAATALAFSTYTGATVTEAMRIDSSGNVGIGTSSPAGVVGSGKTLALYNAGAATISVQAVEAVNDRNATLELLSSGNGGSTSDIVFGDTDTTPATPSPLRFLGRHSGVTTERARIDSNGNFYIGNDTTCNLTNFRSKSLASSGYQKIAGGLIIQWGSTVANGTVTFPIAFPSACVNVNVQLLTSANNYALAYSPSTTSFSIVGNGSATIYWMAMGY